MIRKYVLAALAVLVLAATSRAAEPPVAVVPVPPVAVTDPAAPPCTVRVSVQLGGGIGQSGGGTVIWSEGNESLVLTNAHVADSPTAAYTVHTADRDHGARYLAGSKVTVVGVDALGRKQIAIDGPDLALLVVGRALPCAVIADDEPAPRSRLHTWGFGPRRDPSHGPVYRTGTLTGTKTVTDPNLSSTVSTIDVVSGDSGSGVFNDAGELVAVTHGFEVFDAAPGQPKPKAGLAVPLTTTRVFVKEKGGPRFPKLAKRLEERRGLLGRLFHKRDRWTEVTPAAPPAAKLDPKPAVKDPPKKSVEAPKPKEKVEPKTQPTAPTVTYRVEYYRVGFRTYSRLVPVTGPSANCPDGRCPLVPATPLR